MTRTFLSAKIHRATVTAVEQDYEGSITVDRALCRDAGLLEFEQVDIYDITNGERFTTYVIYGESGQIQINGAAAHLARIGDKIIIAAYVELTPEEVAQHRTNIVLVDERNRPTSIRTKTVTGPG
ncbi:MAG: aspartate 1-decarboxylase [Opitutaceae bacterium]|nr:aspartate 1-decarboxylase [Opitutaceae bacterium]